MNLHLAHNIRTLSISETCLTSLLDKHPGAPEGLKDPEALEGLEGLEILLEDQTPQEEYPLLILFPYNL